MIFHHVALEAVVSVEAPHRLASAEIERWLMPAATRLGLQPGMIEALTGVAARRLWDEGVMPSDVAAQAGVRALEAAGIDAGRVEIVVSTSVCKDFIEPSVASMVHGKLGLRAGCLNFDVGNACLAFLDGMAIVANMIERGQIDYGLVVDGEGSRQVVEATIARLLAPGSSPQMLRDNFATLTLGSGAAAAVLCRAELSRTGHMFRGGVRRAATQWNHLCRGQADAMTTDAPQLLKAGVALGIETFGLAMEELGWRADELELAVMHQVGSAHTATMIRELGLVAAQVPLTYHEYGNMGPAAIPFTLAQAQDRLRRGDRVGLMGIGSGLNCAMMEVVW
jgi:3-oxoacyl-[acyl-carrier-protein] synthase-3